MRVSGACLTRAHRRAALGLLGALAILGACTVGADQRPTLGSATTALSGSTVAPTSSTVPPTTTTTLPPLQVDERASAIVLADPSFRLTDTRIDNKRLEPGVPFAFAVAGSGTIPANATGAFLNVTVIDPDGPGELVVWPEGSSAFPTPSLAVGGQGDASAQLVLVSLPATGRVGIISSVGAHAFVDVAGWLIAQPQGATGGRFEPLAPTRLVDSGASVGVPGALPEGGVVDIDVARDLGGVAASAVLLRVSLTESAPLGWVTIWPAGEVQPAVSHLQTPSLGWSATNLVLVPVRESGRVTLATTAPTSLTVDLIGSVTAPTAPSALEGLVVPLDPPTNVVAADVVPPFRNDLTLDAPKNSASFAWTEVRSAGAVDAGNVWLTAAGQSRRPTDVIALQSGRSTTVMPHLVRVGQQERLTLTADQQVEIFLSVRGYVVGRPIAPDPLIPPVAASPQGTEANPGFDAVIEDLLKSYNFRGAAVAVAKEGRFVYVRAYGSRSEATGAPVRIDTRFRWASMTKMTTAATLLQLVQAGGVTLDQPVFALLADRIRLPDDRDPRMDLITIRDLLRHTSGLRSTPDPFFNGEPGVAEAFGPGGVGSCLDAARWFVSFPLIADPGTDFSYVNMNFCLAGLVVEALTGEPYSDAVRHLTLERRGAFATGTGRSHSFGPNDVEHRTPPLNEPGGGRFMESLGGSGELVGSVIDLVRVVDGLDPAKPGPHLFDDATYRAFTTPQPGGGSWGLGVEIFKPGEFGHSGSLSGARGAFAHQADGVTWAIIVNGTTPRGGDVLRAAMANALAAAGAWPGYDYGPELP